jgi:hypothetical protein
MEVALPRARRPLPRLPAPLRRANAGARGAADVRLMFSWHSFLNRDSDRDLITASSGGNLDRDHHNLMDQTGLHRVRVIGRTSGTIDLCPPPTRARRNLRRSSALSMPRTSLPTAWSTARFHRIAAAIQIGRPGSSTCRVSSTRTDLLAPSPWR